jgi:hypothetical protein
MGSVTALGLQDTILDLETQILYHLKGNHYPPVPAEMVTPCIEAIDAYYDEDYSRKIELPIVDGFQISWKGNTWTTASALVSHAHLEWFIEPVDE